MRTRNAYADKSHGPRCDRLLTNRDGGGSHWFPFSCAAWAFSSKSRTCQIAGLDHASRNTECGLFFFFAKESSGYVGL
jgi:hypothetical protein